MLVFDLDGTAVPNRPDGIPSPAVVEAVHRAQEKVKVGVATGRDLSICDHILQAFPIKGLSILSGGTQLYNPLSQQFEWEQKLSAAQIQGIVDACATFPYYLGVAGEDESLLIREYSNITDKTIIYILNVPNGSESPILKALENIPDIAVHLVVAWQPNCHDVHITHKDATKRHALKVLLDKEGIKPESVMVVGDGGNDLPLFDYAGFKVAVGNGADSLKAAADVVVSSVDDDGLAEAINRFLL